MRIAIDVDDVACNFIERCLDILNKRHDTDYVPAQFGEFNVFNCIPQKDAEILASIFKEKEVWDDMLPPPDAQAAIKKMVAAGHEVFFVSACHPKTHEWKTTWLNRIYPFVPSHNHIYTEQKHLLLVDVLIDDNIEWLRRSVASRIVLTKPWNACEQTGFDLRANNLSEAWDLIREMEEIV